MILYGVIAVIFCIILPNSAVLEVNYDYAVVFSLYFWRPRALDVGRHSKFMLID